MGLLTSLFVRSNNVGLSRKWREICLLNPGCIHSLLHQVSRVWCRKWTSAHRTELSNLA